MGNKKLFLFVVTLLVVLVRFSVIFITPPQVAPTEIDPNQLGYIGLLQNPIIQCLFCLSLIIMLSGFNYVRTLFSESEFGFFFIMILGLICIAVGILWLNWSYIDTKFAELIRMLMYEAYNPQSAPHMSYYQWKYSLNPAKVMMSMLLIPVFLPLFYYLIKMKQQDR